jgi:hypothetical protein
VLPDDPGDLLQRLLEAEVAVAELKSTKKLLQARLADKEEVLQARLAEAHMKWQLENTALAHSNAELMRYQGSYILSIRSASYGGRMGSTPTLCARER